MSDDFDGLVAVSLVDTQSPIGADAVGLQEDQNAPDRLLLLPALADALNPAGAEPLDLLEKNRAFINHGQGPLAESLDDFTGIMRADAFDQPRPEIFFDSFDGMGRSGADVVGFELEAMIAILFPFAGRFDIFAGHGAGEIADDRDFAAPAIGFHAHNAETVLRIMKDDALNDAGQFFRHGDHCKEINRLLQNKIRIAERGA